MKRLPVVAAIRHTLSLTFNHLGPAFRMTWAWFAVFAAVAALFAIIAAVVGVGPDPMSNMLPFMMFLPVFTLLGVAAMASIAVAWHRYVLLDEGGHAGFNLRLDGTVWRYFGNMILVGIGSVLVIGLPFVLLAGAMPLFMVLVPILTVLLAPFIYRLLLKLPAVALERDDFGFMDAFQATRDNYGPLVGVVLIYVLLAVALNLIVTVVSVVGMVFGPLAILVQIVVTAFAQWIGLIFGISLLTTLYGFFVEDRPL